MKKTMIFGICIFLLINFVYAIEICEFEEDPNSLCNAVSLAGMTCSTYTGVWENGSEAFSGTASVLNADAGIYNFTINEAASGGIIIYWCDNTTGYINIKTTDEIDLTTILVNQVVINQNILDTQQNITDTNTTITPREIVNEMSGDLNISLLDINGTISPAEIDAILSGAHGSGSWLINDTGVIVIVNEDKTGYVLVTEDWATSEDINISLETQASLDNNTRDWLGALIQNSEISLNNTITLNIIGSYLADITFGLSALKTLIDVIETFVDILPVIVPSIWSEDLNITLQTYAGIDNETRQEIITGISDVNNTIIETQVNETEIAKCVWGFTDNDATCDDYDRIIDGRF